MFEYCVDVFTKAKEKGLKTALGGAISLDSIDFIKKLSDRDLLDKFETRKLVYGKNSISSIDKAINLGVKFELTWLKSKRRYYHRIRNEDEKELNARKKT